MFKQAVGSVRHNLSSPFLSDLLKRVDAVTLRALKAPKAPAAPAKKAAKPKKPTAAAAKPAPEPQVAKVTIADHPLNTKNTFGQFQDRQERGQRAPRTQRTNAPRGPRGDRPPRRDQKRTAKGPARKVESSKSTGSGAPLKELHAEPLVPRLGGNTFLYGKPVSLAILPSSRVAAVTKDALVASKYPYKLPKLVIAQLPEAHPNQFILQQLSFSVLVNPEQFKERYAAVVKGEPVVVADGKFAGNAAAQFAKHQVSQNGDLSLQQRQQVFDVVTGGKSLQEVFKEAAWTK